MIQVGDIRIHLVSDGITMADPGGPFGLVPRALYRQYYEPDENFMIPMCLTCLLVQVDGMNIVVDTGLGNKLNDKQRRIWGLTRPEGGLLDGLARLGIQPEDVHLVIDTHLHADHCSGNTYYVGDTLMPTFPNAEYVVQRREYQDASHPNERTAATYHDVNWQPLIENGQMRLLDGDTVLAPGVMGVVTPGHTPGHMSVCFESQGQHAMFVCDMASFAVHFEKLGWMTAYDVEPLVTLETKRRWQQWAFEHDAVVIFPHDVKRPAGRLRKNEKGRFELAVVPV
ncbi:MAG: MBL fold metallo-hydrolase [Phototrophicales bacterium]|nr:MAG: MBL fold metallo-hydrolase [Phototrophicales bacterium]RMG70747.1 MAG: MBL fold metallo-hydrolase [Chloroflexota bacterium]